MIKRLVTKIIDGDTFMVDKPVQRSRYIRIAGIDAPEKRQRGYQSAKIKLAKKNLGKEVEIIPVGRSYSRIVAKVKLNRRLIK